MDRYTFFFSSQETALPEILNLITFSTLILEHDLAGHQVV